MLQRMASDRGLKQFTYVVLDEAHKRDVMADLILAILKQEWISRANARQRTSRAGRQARRR